MPNWFEDPAVLDKWTIIEVQLDEADCQEYNEYLDWLEATTGEQEMPEDFSY
jgi:hypothetical protein